VIRAREKQVERFEGHAGIYANAQMSSRLLKEICIIQNCRTKSFEGRDGKLNLSARAYDRILKVSRTIADLAIVMK